MNIGFALCFSFSFVRWNVYEKISSKGSYFIPVENIRKCNKKPMKFPTFNEPWSISLLQTRI